jgi:hypothetical protein
VHNPKERTTDHLKGEFASESLADAGLFEAGYSAEGLAL